VQLGHKCVVRVGLNELSDDPDFDFQAEVPVGRAVVGRVTKCIDNQGAEMRFNASLRQSIVEYGCG